MNSTSMNSVGSPPSAAVSAGPPLRTHVLRFRVRYSETDQMGTFYNSRPLEWFECGRSELFRDWGLPYAELEQRGVLLPVIESCLHYLGRARYDDLLDMTTVLSQPRRARLRCDVTIVQAAGGARVVQGYTVHAFTDPSGRPMRPPPWLTSRWAAVPRDAVRLVSDVPPSTQPSNPT